MDFNFLLVGRNRPMGITAEECTIIYAVILFTQIYRDLYGNAMLGDHPDEHMAAGNQQKHLSLSFAKKV